MGKLGFTRQVGPVLFIFKLSMADAVLFICKCIGLQFTLLFLFVNQTYCACLQFPFFLQAIDLSFLKLALSFEPLFFTK